MKKFVSSLITILVFITHNGLANQAKYMLKKIIVLNNHELNTRLQCYGITGDRLQ